MFWSRPSLILMLYWLRIIILIFWGIRERRVAFLWFGNLSFCLIILFFVGDCSLICRQGFKMISRCYICTKEVESINHLFVASPLAAAIWQFISHFFRIVLDTSSSLLRLFQVAFLIPLSKQLFSLLLNAIILAIYFIKGWGINLFSMTFCG